MKKTPTPDLIRRFPTLFAARAADSHKGSFGTLAILGGSSGMSGALVLASSAALLSGCGRVYAAFCQDTLPAPWIAGYPEIMLARGADIFAQPALNTWAAGCGMGTNTLAHDLLARLIAHARQRQQPLILDADALNLLALHPPLADALTHANTLKILTPHPGEAARLLASSIADVQQSRAASAQRLSQRFQAWVVLKGHASIIAAPDGTLFTNDSGNAALATAGSGDVLTGMIASYVAQGIAVQEAVCGAVWLHGYAADSLSAGDIPLAGLLAGEIAGQARALRQQFTALMQKT